jgi:archaellum component FlaC
MTANEAAALEQLRNNYDSIHDNLDDLLDACDGDAECKKQVGTAMNEALESYVRAQTRILNQSNDDIAAINKAASDAQDAIEAALQNLKDIKNFLDNVTQGVKIVGGLVEALA